MSLKYPTPQFSFTQQQEKHRAKSSPISAPMGLLKEEKSKRLWRGIKTLFFLITMLISLLLFSAPVLLVVADALLSASLCPFSLASLPAHLANYDFKSSLIDIPFVSFLRSAIIFCVYSFCDGPSLSRGPYLVITTLCSLVSLVFVSLKASFVFGRGGGYAASGVEVALFVCSLVLAVAHVAVAYRTSCRERRKLLVYKIDIEAVSACKSGFPRYQKILQEERVK